MNLIDLDAVRADGGAPPRGPWQAVDIEPVLNGAYRRPQPTVGARSDGQGLLYPGRQHAIYSESEAGKSWLALAICAAEMQREESALFVDFEDDEGGVVGRLLAMESHPNTIRERFNYVRPDRPIGNDVHRSDLAQIIGDTRPTVVIIDGITEAMVLHGLNPMDNVDVAEFGGILPRWIAEKGPAVAMLDHVTKSPDGRGRYAIGAVHKLNGLNGAAYALENRRPFAIGLTGTSTLRIAKDRPGELRRHGLPGSGGMHWYGDLVLASELAGPLEVSINAPQSASDSEYRPTHLMAKLHKIIAAHQGKGGLSGQMVQHIARGNSGNNRQALAFLELDGYITPTPHSILKDYPGSDAKQGT